MNNVKVTLRDVKEQLNVTADMYLCANILWADVCREGDSYNLDYGVVPGTLLFGVSYINDGNLEKGTIKVEPPKIFGLLC